MSYFPSRLLDDQTIPKPTRTVILRNDETFLKEFSRNFYRKLTDTNDLNTIENTLSEWTKNIDNYEDKIVLNLMQNHEENESCFSSCIGFFYQHGICCKVDVNKELEL